VRLQPIEPGTMEPSIHDTYVEMRELIAAHLNTFVTQREDGALIGPFSPLLHFPELGKPSWGLIKQLIASATLPKAAREVAVLLTGARLNSRYEIYSHEHVAEQSGLSTAKVATLSAGERPSDLDEQESAAFDVTAALLRGNQLPETTYRRALRAFGDKQLAELVFLIGGYVLISLLLNAYDISVPGREEGLPQG
jgi:4-carboxymuconolactone decarboxylase